MISLNYSVSSLAVTMCKAMALCQAFTRSSSKLNKGNRYCWKLMHEVPSLLEEYAIAVDTPCQTSPRLKTVAAQFVCRPILYCNDSNDQNDVVVMRLRVLAEKTKDVERIPNDHSLGGFSPHPAWVAHVPLFSTFEM